MATILIADGDPIFRKGLRSVLEGIAGISVQAEAAGAGEILSIVSKNRGINLVISEIRLARKDGLALLADLRRLGRPIQVLFFTRCAECEYAFRALNAGARGYLCKGCSVSQLIQAVKIIMSGDRYMSPNLQEWILINGRASAGRAPHELLSNREYAIMLRIARGEQKKSIADSLGLSPKTITSHRVRILLKMKANCDADLTRYVILHHLDSSEWIDEPALTSWQLVDEKPTRCPSPRSEPPYVGSYAVLGKNQRLVCA